MPIATDNPDPKLTLVEKIFQSPKQLSYKNFNYQIFVQFKDRMENFRRNVAGENMELVWKNLKRSYLPKTTNELQVSAEYTLDTDGNATPTRFFAESNDKGLVDLKEPLVAIKLHTALSILTARTPDVLWDSDNEKYEEQVPVLNALRKLDWMDDQTRQQYTLLWFYDILYGTSFWRRFYDRQERNVAFVSDIDLVTEKMKYKNDKVVEISQTVGEALSPSDVWIDPSTCPQKPRSMRFVKYDKVYDFHTFRRLFEGLSKPEKLDKVKPTSIEGFEGQEMVRCEYFEHKDLDLYYVVANDEPILKRHLPWNHKDLSIRMTTWLPRGEHNPYGLGPIEMMAPNKELLDELLNMTMNQVRYSVYKAMFYSGNLEVEGGESGDIRLRPDRAYKSSDPKSITFMDVPGPGTDAWKSIDMLRGRVDDASGINRPLGGEITGSTAFEIDIAKDAALARLGVPIANMTQLLRWDAEITFELQKQHYTLPEVKEMVDPDEIQAAIAELDALKASGTPAKFDIWFDETNPDNPKVFRGDYRSVNVSTQQMPDGQAIPALSKEEVVLTPAIYDWRGKFFVVADSILTLSPTLERTKKLEAYNMMIPMFGKPAELFAKPARALSKLYNLDIEDLFPQAWLDYLKAVDAGTPPPQLVSPKIVLSRLSPMSAARTP